MYDIFLLEKPDTDGLTKAEIMDMMDSMAKNEVYPMELTNPCGTSVAMGFITVTAADKLNYQYDDNSEIGTFLRSILNDMTRETENMTYTYKDISICMCR